MTYKEIFDMVAVTAYNRFPKGFNYEGLQNCIVENATKIYIEQMKLEKEKLQEEYNELYEGHDKLSHEWALVKKQYRELSCKYDDLIKKYSELLEDFNRINSEPLLRKMTIAELKERGFLRNESK